MINDIHLKGSYLYYFHDEIMDFKNTYEKKINKLSFL